MDPVVQDILNVAVAEFAAHGLAGARVDAIAARTRTSKRMLYYHFGNKDGLYAAALAHAYARVRQDGAPPLLDHLPALQALREYAGHVFDTHARHPDFVRLVMGENLLAARYLRQTPAIRNTNLLGLEELRAIVQRGQADGSMRPDLDLLDLYANLVGLAFHFVSNRATFSAIFEHQRDPAQVQQARRRSIADTIVRQAMRLPDGWPDGPVDAPAPGQVSSAGRPPGGTIAA